MSLAAGPIVLQLEDIALEGSLELPDEDLGGLVMLLRLGALEPPELERALVGRLNRAGIGALRLGLLTAQEAHDASLTLELRFDINLQARRVVAAIEWLLARVPACSRIGLFATDTAGAAALVAAARRPELVEAVTLLRGRPDLAVSAADRLVAPTLLIAGGSDEPAIHCNEIAASHLHGPHELLTIPGTGHFTGQRSSIDTCAELTCGWFSSRLASGDLSRVG
ncbi:MAG TPA: alpha/beta hydrolase [Polyangiaceae bacterium]|nr:alpha/beta hydrolase [Polyangiaceae bacterium]